MAQQGSRSYAVLGAAGVLFRWLIFSGYAVLITSLSLDPFSSEIQYGSDKLAHFLAYFVFASLAVIVVRDKRQYMFCCLVIVLYGGLLEIAQSFLPYRSMSFLDFLSNGIGGSVGYFVVTKFLARRQFRS